MSIYLEEKVEYREIKIGKRTIDQNSLSIFYLVNLHYPWKLNENLLETQGKEVKILILLIP